MSVIDGADGTGLSLTISDAVGYIVRTRAELRIAAMARSRPYEYAARAPGDLDAYDGAGARY